MREIRFRAMKWEVNLLVPLLLLLAMFISSSLSCRDVDVASRVIDRGTLTSFRYDGVLGVRYGAARCTIILDNQRQYELAVVEITVIDQDGDLQSYVPLNTQVRLEQLGVTGTYIIYIVDVE